MNDRKSPSGDQRAEWFRKLSSKGGTNTMQSKSAIPDGNARKRIEKSKSYPGVVLAHPRMNASKQHQQNSFIISVRKYTGLRGVWLHNRTGSLKLPQVLVSSVTQQANVRDLIRGHFKT